MSKKYPTQVDHCTKCMYHKEKGYNRRCRLVGRKIIMKGDAEFNWIDLSNPQYEDYNLERGFPIKHSPDWCPLEEVQNDL